jgi:hypothetical protein
MNNNNQQDDQPVLNRLPFNILGQPNAEFNNINQDNNLNNFNNNRNQQGFLDSLTPNEVVDIGMYLVPSILYTIAITIGLSMTSNLCSNSYAIALKVMISINIICLCRAFYHLLLISLKNSNTDFGKASLSLSNWFLYSIYYLGAVGCFVVYLNRPDNCFKGKYEKIYIIKFC